MEAKFWNGTEWEMKVEVNSVEAFLDAKLILDSTTTTRTGNLYDAYKEFCEAGGLSKFSIVKFPRLLADILADENLPFRCKRLPIHCYSEFDRESLCKKR